MGRLPVVAIVGRPNVGKSTLFNRLVRQRKAVVEDTPGVTRDRLYARTQVLGKPFLLVDTGGIDLAEKDPLRSQACLQALAAVEEADVLLFVVDGKEGLTPADHEVAEVLRRAGKPFLLVANKLESPKEHAEEVYELGLGDFLRISALHGHNIGDLMEALAALLPETEEGPAEEDLRVAIVGRPNVGKSSLLNAILGEERVIVSEIPGTTRDAIDVGFSYQGQHWVLVDTAGIRRQAQIKAALEYYCLLRAIQAIERSDVAVVVLDALEGVTAQDKRIMGLVQEAGRAMIVAVNKWDVMEQWARTKKSPSPPSWEPFLSARSIRHLKEDYTRILRHEAPFADYAPVLYLSALRREGIQALLEEIASVAEHHALRIPTSRLNEVLQQALFDTPPPSRKGRPLKVFYATQVGVKPPTILLFVNDPERMHFSYQRYLENRLRQAFGFRGTPMRLILRARR